MGRIKRILPILCVVSFIGAGSLAQTNTTKSHSIRIEIPEIALIDLEANSGTSVSLQPVSPTEAGNALDFSGAGHSEIWINYSSLIGNSESQRKVSAYIDGTIPDGVTLYVTASSYSGSGNGKTGIPAGRIALSGEAQDIITDIGSCYTGDGANNGHLLHYSLELNEGDAAYSNLNFDQSTTLYVAYTLSDDN